MSQLVGTSSLGLGKLINGETQFVHIRYSANADGSNMTTEIQSNTKYIGIVTSNSQTSPTSPEDYSWGRFVGTSGVSSYTWVRYSANEDGSNMTAAATEATKYIGVAITSDNNAPKDYTEYSWALIKGDDGRGISKTEVSYQKSTSGTVIPTGEWATSIPKANAGEYLWTRTLFTYTDDTTSSAYNVARNGVAGLGISNSDVDYQKSTSGTVIPTGAWTATIPTVAANEYLWTRTTMTYTDDSTSISYSVGKMGADGKDAQLLYLTASSQIQAFDKDNKPKTTQPITISAKLQNASGTATFVAIPYIGNTAQTAIILGGTGNDRTLLPSQWINTQWTTVAITATLGSLTDTISVIRVKDGATGDKGADGIAGKDGVGIKTTEITYQLGDSGSSVPSGTWSLAVPTLVKGKYLWTRTKWTYTDNATEMGYTTSYIAKDGNTGNDGIAGKDGVGISKTVVEYQGGTSGTTKPTGSWSATVPNVAQGNFLWTRTTWSYTDGTSEQGYSVSRIGSDGADGADGLPGKDGVSIVSTTQYWVLSDSGTTQPTTGWSTSIPTFVKGKYLWTKTVWRYSDNSTEEGYTPIYISKDGSNGSDGLPGKDGVGIVSTTFAYATSTRGTTPPTSGWSATIPTVADGYYLWTRTTWTYTDNTSESGYSVARSIRGETGRDGIAGKDGVGIKSTTVVYALSVNGTTAPTSGWNANVPTLVKGQYLWTKTTWTYTDNASETGYSVTYIARDGNNGTDGIAGKDGVGITSTSFLYAQSTSGTTAPTSGWSTSIPYVVAGSFLWTKTSWNYTDGTTESAYTVSMMGRTGSDGIAGRDGIGIKTTVIEYAQSTSGSTAPSTGWTAQVPTLVKGKYLWTRTVWTYTNSSTETGYTVSYNAKDGNNGTNGVAGKDGVGISDTIIEYVGSTSGTTTPTSGWSATIPTVPAGQYLWTRTTWKYTDGTSEQGFTNALMGRTGASGKDGVAGKDGVGIKSTQIMYAQSTSGTTAPPTGWTAQVPTLIKGQYLWTQTTWVYTDNTGEAGYTVSYNAKDGNNGTNGIAGKDGVGISSTKIEYAGSTSGTTKPTSGWSSTTIPTVVEGNYLWTKTTWTYTDNTSEVGYSVAKMGAKGDTGASATSYWITPSVNTIQISTTKVLNPTTITFTGYSKTGTANAGLYAGRFNILTSVDGIVYSSKYSSSANQSAYTYTVPADVKFIKARMYQAGGTSVLVDEQTVPIIESAEGLEIGGRNWFLNSYRNFVNSNVAEYWSVIGAEILFETMGLQPGDDVTFSVYIKVPTNAPAGAAARINFYRSDNTYTQKYGNYILPGKEGVSSVTFKVPSSSNPFTRVRLGLQRQNADGTGNTFTVQRKEEMFTKGNVVLDWTPAPEDAKLFKRWSNDPNGLVDMTDIYPNENLFVGSVSEYRTASVGQWTGTMGFSSVLEDIGVKVGDSITLSAYFKNPTTAPDKVASRINFIKADGNYIVAAGNSISPGTEGRSIVSGTIPTGTVKITCYIGRTGGSETAQTFNTQIMKEKLEIGTQATIYTANQQDDKLLSIPQYVGVGSKDTMNPADFVWSVSPEYTKAIADKNLSDFDTQINESITGNIENLTSIVENKVENDEVYQTMIDLVEALNNAFQKFTDPNDGQAVEMLNALEERTASLIQNLGETVAEYNFINTYMKLGDEGFMIGKQDGNLRMLLTDNRLSFVDGDTEVAYFSNQEFKINRGAIVQSLQIGTHKFTDLKNGHTVVGWTGAENLIKNGSFERGTEFWLNSPEIHSIGYTGNCLIRRATGTNMFHYSDPITVVPNQRYIVSYYFNNSSDFNGSFGETKFRISDDSSNHLASVPITSSRTSWTKIEAYWTCPSNITSVRVQLVFANTAGWGKYDDVVFKMDL